MNRLLLACLTYPLISCHNDGGPLSYRAPTTASFNILTDDNRFHLELSGGWAPHLRGLMRDRNGTLWFVVDNASSLMSNDRVIIYRLRASNWEKVESVELQSNVNQNTAQLIQNSTVIHIYSISSSRQTAEECYYNVIDAKKKCSQIEINGTPLQVRPGSNYIGATISRDQTIKIFYWTTSIYPPGIAHFSYIYKKDEKWHGPFDTELESNSLGYASLRFRNNQDFILCGQTFTGTFPVGTYNAVVGQATLGENLTFAKLKNGKGGYSESCEDIAIDPTKDAAHIVSRSLDGYLYYHYKDFSSPWTDESLNPRYFIKPDEVKLQMIRARFLITQSTFGLIYSGTYDDLRFFSIPYSKLGKFIDWGTTDKLKFSVNDTFFGRSTGIYVESAQHSGRVAAQLNFAVAGLRRPLNPNYTDGDKRIYHVILH